MLGDKYDSNKKKNTSNQAPNTYCRLNLANSLSTLDPSKLGFEFWNGLLKISIAPFIESTKSYDYDNEGSIYISHFKAKILSDEIALFLKDPKAYNNLGVSSGDGVISISNGMEITGEYSPCMIIRKVDENGNATSSYLYQFKEEFHYSIRNYDEKSANFDKIYHDAVEIEVLKMVLDEYFTSTSGAYAHANIDYGRFNNSRINTKLDSIAEKLGIEYTNNSRRGRNKSTSRFDKAEGRNYTSKDIDDIENEM